MITFTKEQLIASAHARIEFAEMMLAGELEPLKERTWSIELELARIALASLEAEPVAYTDAEELRFPHATSDMWPVPLGHGMDLALYTAPPAPVSDSLLSELLDIAKRAADEADECAHAEFSDDSMEHSAAIADWERRAAMLQGAEQPQSAQQNIHENIPTLKDAVIAVRNSGIAIDGEMILAERDALNSPDCGCRTCRPVTISDMRFVVCPECGNKRCPHANDHRNACTGSNEPGQEGSAYPAAPQKEDE
ncbi:MAG: hypothetical protein ACRC8W_05025 [Plesiomonas shigelloides]